MNVFDPRTQEAETNGSLSWMPAYYLYLYLLLFISSKPPPPLKIFVRTKLIVNLVTPEAHITWSVWIQGLLRFLKTPMFVQSCPCSQVRSFFGAAHDMMQLLRKSVIMTTSSLEGSYNLPSGSLSLPLLYDPLELWCHSKRRLSLLVGDTDKISSQDASAGVTADKGHSCGWGCL